MAADRILKLLGLAAKAGKVVSGDFSTLEAIRSRKAFLVLIALDASKNTTKKFTDKSRTYEIPMIRCAPGEALGHAIGKDFRAVAALTDEGFAKRIQELAE